MSDRVPYLSVVVAARNDDHGGNLLGRIQAFVNSWLAQARQYELSSELIFVEWNPLPDRARLADALRWPADLGPCQVRFIEVPREIHRRFRSPEAIPLHQMIAKNVGIRRARGEFVLATNIDILFSDELVRFLAARDLKSGRLYRVDRYDVPSDVPIDVHAEERLSWCEAHLLRIFAREGCFTLTSEGRRQLLAQDITWPDSGISFGPGWFPPERYTPNEVFRWVDTEAELLLSPPRPESMGLALELEPGPGVGGKSFLLRIADESGTLVAETAVTGRSKLLIRWPAAGLATGTLRFHVGGGGRGSLRDPRILNFRVFRCEWANARDLPSEAPFRRRLRAAMAVQRMLRRQARWYRDTGEYFALLGRGREEARCAARLVARVARTDDVFEPDGSLAPGQGWFTPELDTGEVFRWVERDAELVVRAPAADPSLALLIEPGPGVGCQAFELVVRSREGQTLARTRVERLTYLEIPLDWQRGQSEVLCLTLEGGNQSAGRDNRILNFRVFACGWSRAPELGAVSEHWTVDALSSRPGFDWASESRESEAAIAEMGSPALLHLNASGDFALMAREHWFELRGYPEFDLWPLHIDSILVAAAHHGGAPQELLPTQMRVYHIEHRTGAGWTPEGEAELYQRIAAKGTGFVHYQEVVRWITQMRRLRCPMIFNMEDWGLAGCELAECELDSTGSET